MTRAENMRKIGRKKEEANYRKVINIITGLYANDYKKADGSWNVTKIAKDSGLSRPTVIKHLASAKKI